MEQEVVGRGGGQKGVMKIRKRSRELEEMDEENKMRTGVREREVRGRNKNRRCRRKRGKISRGAERKGIKRSRVAPVTHGKTV